jgi:hypothetical protein
MIQLNVLAPSLLALAAIPGFLARGRGTLFEEVSGSLAPTACSTHIRSRVIDCLCGAGAADRTTVETIDADVIPGEKTARSEGK